MSSTLLDLLVSQKIINEDQLNTVLQGRPRNTASHLDVEKLFAAQILSEKNLVDHLNRLYSLPIVIVGNVDPNALNLFPLNAVIEYKCLPFRTQNNTVTVAVADPSRSDQLKAFIALSKLPIEFVLTTYSNLEEHLQQILKLKPTSQVEKTQASGPTNPAAGRSLGPQTKPLVGGEATQTAFSHRSAKRFNAKEPVPNVLNEILCAAIDKGASDIHIEPGPKNVAVRIRVEGSLVEVFQIPTEMRDQLTSRIKILATLDTSERKVPQDGRFKFSTAKAEYNFRLNTMPTIYGEAAAIRVLRPESIQLKLKDMGFTADQLRIVSKGINAPSGMVLITGPTGSGKTTTLYSAMSEVNKRTDKLVTVEDPVEYTLEGITQVQVNTETGLTFPTVLKALLRQDPDVILVGEIRDSETATIAIQAAISGHLVLSTLHTHDAPSAILRLLNIGIEPFLVLTSVTTVIAQRLIRKICPDCKRPMKVTEDLLSSLGEDRALVDGAQFFRGVGCERCHWLGFKGRIPIYEVLSLNEPMKESILKGENPITFKRKAMEHGMVSLRQSALTLVATGVISLDEALAATVEV